MWDERRFTDNVNRLSEALNPLTSPGTSLGAATIKEAAARGRHVVEQIRRHVVPYLSDLVAQDAVGMLGRLEALLDQMGNNSSTRDDRIRAAGLARAHLSQVVQPTIAQALARFEVRRPANAVSFAQDIRVCELQFLAAIEREGDLRLIPGADGFRDAPPDVVRQMVYSLLEDRSLNGPASLSADADPAHAETRRYGDLTAVLGGAPIHLRLNHSGRLRLARLRDEMLSFDARERFGILLDARGMNRVLAAELAVTRAERPLAVIFGDVDHFKKINDDFGHPMGDQVLMAVFRIFSEEIDARGKAFRYGGEEVLGVLPIDASPAARAVAESVRQRVSGEVDKACDLPRALTISLGVAVFRDGDATPEQATRFADGLLYKAKESGRDRVVVEDFVPARSAS